MSLEVELFTIAEGAVVSNNGQLSLFNVRPVFELPAFPALVRFSIAVIAADDEKPEPMLVADRTASVKFEIIDAGGTVVAAGASQAAMSARASSASPKTLQFAGDVVMQFDKPDVYEVDLVVDIDGDRVLDIKKDLYILQRTETTDSGAEASAS